MVSLFSVCILHFLNTFTWQWSHLNIKTFFFWSQSWSLYPGFTVDFFDEYWFNSTPKKRYDAKDKSHANLTVVNSLISMNHVRQNLKLDIFYENGEVIAHEFADVFKYVCNFGWNCNQISVGIILVTILLISFSPDEVRFNHMYKDFWLIMRTTACN